MLPREALRRGRELRAPFDVVFAGAAPVRVEEILRLVPGERLVARVRRDGAAQLMKLFASRRACARERRGLCRLAEAALPAPRLLAADATTLFLEYLPAARPLAECLAGAEAAQRVWLLRAALALIERLHAAGLRHADPHFGNFLCDAAGLHLVDAGAVRAGSVLPGWRVRNLALFCCQLPLAQRQALAEALGPARWGNPALQRAIARADRRRVARRARKAARSCGEFVSRRRWRERLVLRRELDGPALRALLADPDAALCIGTLLKDGNTATLARIDCEGRTLVLKRYNIKGWRHALSRSWRPSRAWRAWQNAARFGALGIATPLPVAVLERRWGPLRGRAWLLTEHVEASPLAAALRDATAQARIARGLRELFAALRVLGRSHGDCKASNFLFDGASVWTLDLDGMRRRPGVRMLERALARDRARLLRNFDGATAERLATLLASGD